MTMTTLQEAIERARSTAMSQAAKARIPECGEFAAIAQDLDFVCAALAQQGERKNCPQPEICGSKECEFCRDTAAPAPQAQEPIAKLFGTLPVYDTPAPQPAQDVPEVGFWNMPYSPYLFGGLRFKMNFDKSGNATNFHGAESALQGAWVALVDATDNCHLQSAQPVAQPLTLEQILDIVKKLDETPDMSHVDVLKTFARAIEAAHGIRDVK